MPNRLATETSPYLRQHADNPVDWRPWGAEALAAARAQEKPILLSIGYSACHWCHVMAHESFEDPATAAVMNDLYINIKVDREERPDLDKIYQLAHQALTRRGGGWPLTVFLTPDDHLPFYAGTYFPKEPRYGMPPFVHILQQVRGFWDQRRDDARALVGMRRRRSSLPTTGPAESAAESLTDAPIRAALSADRTSFRSAIRRPCRRAEISALRGDGIVAGSSSLSAGSGGVGARGGSLDSGTIRQQRGSTLIRPRHLLPPAGGGSANGRSHL